MPIATLVPILVYFLTGVLLRRTRWVNAGHATAIFRFVFYFTLPALAFTAIADKHLSLDSAALPVTGFLVNSACVAMALLYARRAGLDSRMTGTLVLGTGIANTVFIFPFVLAVLGPSALGDAVLYDIGNAIFVATVAYGLASRFGDPAGATVWSSTAKILRSPLFVAVFAAIIVSVGGIATPPWLRTALEPLGSATPPLILVALGVGFSTARLRDSVVYATVLVRMAGGLVTGLVLVFVFSLQETTALTVLACAMAPVGFNAVTLASIGKLDVEHATASLAVSIVVGFVTTTALTVLGSQWLVSAS
jgi:predicted permease